MVSNCSIVVDLQPFFCAVIFRMKNCESHDFSAGITFIAVQHDLWLSKERCKVINRKSLPPRSWHHSSRNLLAAGLNSCFRSTTEFGEVPFAPFPSVVVERGHVLRELATGCLTM